MSTRLKLSSEAFLLTALLPIPKFIHKSRRIRSLLADRLIHESLDIILQPLKDAARLGIMMNDPLGNLRFCFPLLASYIVDTPEASMLAGVAGKTSPITTAMYLQFGDPHQHPLRTKSHTLTRLRRIKVNPDHLRKYLASAQEYRLNGVAFPFFRDWHMAEPPRFLTPEPLHEWHKQIWDHVVRWAINIVGAEEIDFRFSVLQPSIGYRHFREGISQLKQVTGRAQRDVQRSLIAVVAGSAPRGVITAMRVLLDFCY
jgi:Plavaka transposase